MSRPVGTRDAIAALHRGIALSLGDEELKGRIAVSIIVNGVAFVLLLAGLLWGAVEVVGWALDGAVAADPAWYETLWYAVRDGLRWLLYVVFIVGALFYSPVLFTILASAVLPAFHGPVFDAARARVGGPAVTGSRTPWVRTLVLELTRLVRFIALSLLILPLNLVPVVGSLVYLAAQLYLSARTLGWDLLAYHFELHGMDMPAQKAFVRQNTGLVLALGGGATLLAMVPVVQLLFITTNVAGAGVLSAWLDGAPRAR
jgi:uncharacterized protein involved in cysteine biosynthesis